MYKKREQRKKNKEDDQSKSCTSTPINWVMGE